MACWSVGFAPERLLSPQLCVAGYCLIANVQGLTPKLDYAAGPLAGLPVLLVGKSTENCPRENLSMPLPQRRASVERKHATLSNNSSSFSTSQADHGSVKRRCTSRVTHASFWKCAARCACLLQRDQSVHFQNWKPMSNLLSPLFDLPTLPARDGRSQPERSTLTMQSVIY